jgi:hypothetical protein
LADVTVLAGTMPTIAKLMAWLYDESIAEEHECVFLEDMLGCEEVTLGLLDALTWPQDFRDHAARLAPNWFRG